MWVCPHCQHQNSDSATVCEACGRARAGRRFGSAPQQSAGASASPRVMPAQTAVSSQPSPMPQPVSSAGRGQEAASASRMARRAAYQENQDEYEYEEEEWEEVRPQRSWFATVVGVLLMILLPLLTALLFWRQYDLLSQALLPLYLTEKAPDWLRSVFYGLFTAGAVLLSLLPGLWTTLLARKK